MRFMAAWSESDLYDRFCSTAHSSVDWFAESLRHARHRAIVAWCATDAVALLDYVDLGRTLELGLFVAAEHRRRGLGTHLMRRLLVLARGVTIVAHTRADNVAAIGLLRSCGFRLVWQDSNEVRFQHAAISSCNGVSTRESLPWSA